MLVDAKTQGNKAAFSRFMGWGPQYLNNMLKGKSLGLQPIITILEHCPDINPRWLILGTGPMYSTDYLTNVLLVALRRSMDIDSMDFVERLNFHDAVMQLNDTLL